VPFSHALDPHRTLIRPKPTPHGVPRVPRSTDHAASGRRGQNLSPGIVVAGMAAVEAASWSQTAGRAAGRAERSLTAEPPL